MIHSLTVFVVLYHDQEFLIKNFAFVRLATFCTSIDCMSHTACFLQISWTEALRTIVNSCYRYHGRDDLLHVFGDQDSPSGQQNRTMYQTINNPDGSVSIIQIEAAPNQVVTLPDGSQATVVHTVSSIHSGYNYTHSKFTILRLQSFTQ